MLFNSHIFIFTFLPTVLLVYHLIGRITNQRRATELWLIVSSLFFYGWWDAFYLILIIGSIVFNYIFVRLFLRKRSKVALLIGLSANISLLAYYKYMGFLIETLSVFLGYSFDSVNIVLPLAISFFTFQQITFVVDAYKQKLKNTSFVDYVLFITFFPQLIAGPIVHHRDMLHQFRNLLPYLKTSNLVIGITIFVFGLFKKVVIADNIALYATPIFTAADIEKTLTFFEAWGGGTCL